MKKINKLIVLLITAIGILLTSCKKDWLDAKPSQDLVVPTTAKDFQALLDNTSLFNYNVAGIGEIGTDNISLTDSRWQSSREIERSAYIWSNTSVLNNNISEWDNAYKRILNENITLEGVDKNGNPADTAWKNIKGTALFFRAYDYYSLAQLFCKPFTTNAASDPGIVLRKSSDVNEKSIRATVQQTYQQIISDLTQSRNLLPEVPVYKTRPSVPAAYAMLARVYLSMGDYDNALLYADSTLQRYSKLLDYNTIDATARRPFPLFNDEVIFHWMVTNYGLLFNATVDPNLYAMYESNDLRKSLFFSATMTFRNSYTGNAVPFNGLATDEVFLIRAECRARNGYINGAADDINTLLAKRWKNNGTFAPLTFGTREQALQTILGQRRKELVMRGLRWTDLRRLNQDAAFAVTLRRTVNGMVYDLPPNDVRYTHLIPQLEINSSGISQNPR